MSEGYALEPAELDALVRHLSEASTELQAHQRSLAITPDAGRSSAEVASVFGLLAAAVTGLAGQIASASSTLSTTVGDYRDAEGRTVETFGAVTS